jgi:hypothetical protein
MSSSKFRPETAAVAVDIERDLPWEMNGKSASERCWKKLDYSMVIYSG